MLRQCLERQEAGPVIFPGPARGRQETVAGQADWHLAGGHHADGALDIGKSDILLRCMEIAQRFVEIRRALRPVHAKQRLRRAVLGGEQGRRQGKCEFLRLAIGGQRLPAAAMRVGDNRTMTAGADGHGHVLAATYRNDLLARLERKAALGRQVAGRVGRIDLLDEDVGGVAMGGGEAPGDTAIMADQQHRHARYGRARLHQAGGFDPRQIPERRVAQPEMRIIGQQRLAAGGMAAIQRPDIGGKPGRQGRGQCCQRARRKLWRQRRHRRRHAPRIGIGVPELIDLLRREMRGELGALQFGMPVAGQLHRHQLAPDQAVGGPPGFRLVAQQYEFRRQRAAVSLKPGIYPLGIGFQCLPQAG